MEVIVGLHKLFQCVNDDGENDVFLFFEFFIQMDVSVFLFDFFIEGNDNQSVIDCIVRMSKVQFTVAGENKFEEREEIFDILIKVATAGFFIGNQTLETVFVFHGDIAVFSGDVDSLADAFSF